MVRDSRLASTRRFPSPGWLVGCHHRIPYEALVEWRGRNRQYGRESA